MRWNRNDDCGNDCAIAGCEGARAGEGGVTRTIFVGEVVPFCAQLSAHKSSAPVSLVVSVCPSAALQQSISIMPTMLHSFSPKCSGTPAHALPASASKRNKDESRFIWIGTLFDSVSELTSSSPARLWKLIDTGIRNRSATVVPEFWCAFCPAELSEVRNFTRPPRKIRKRAKDNTKICCGHNPCSVC